MATPERSGVVATSSWFGAARQRRAERAAARNLVYQSKKAAALQGREHEAVEMMQSFSRYVESLITPEVRLDGARVLEVGCGAHGLAFYFHDTSRRVGIDPAAVECARLFPLWQRRVPTVAAVGEALPFPTAIFDIVVSHNVVDHAEQPPAIMREMIRVLRPGGALYFTVNVHHWIYAAASQVYGVLTAARVPLEIPGFADHTVHMTPGSARRLVRALPLRLIAERVHFEWARQRERAGGGRLLPRVVRRLFFTEVMYEVVAVRERG